MVLVRFLGGPWDGTEREMELVETDSVLTESFYTDDPGAGHYKIAGERMTGHTPTEVVWHPSTLRGGI